MSVIRNTRKTHFTITPNATLRDQVLSLQAKGLLALMLSFPDDWEYTMSHLQGLSTNGRDAHRNAMRELIDAGYVNRVPRRQEDGRVDGWDFIVSDTAFDRTPENPSHGDSTERLKNRPTEKPSDGKPATTNTHSTKNDSTKTPPTPPTLGVGEEEVEKHQRQPPRHTDKLNALRTRHPKVHEVLGRLSTDRAWRPNQFQTVAVKVLDLADRYGETEVHAGLQEILMAGDRITHPIRWLDRALAKDEPVQHEKPKPVSIRDLLGPS